MAKAPAKKPAAKKVAAPAKKSAARKSPGQVPSIDKVSKSVLAKLKDLQLDGQLQADIEWCMGSFENDQNPIGLYETGARALELLKSELARKTKGVTAKMVGDLEKALASR
jgi:hypothetical protein